MMVANLWNDFGYSSSPYLTEALSSESGSELLVGRDDEVAELIQQLASGSRVQLLIGDNGVGKTSIANVAAYRMTRGMPERSARYFVIRPLRIGQPFELKDFEQNLHVEIAKALLDESDFLAQSGVRGSDIKSVHDVLFKPSFTPITGGVSILGSGISGGQTITLNPELAGVLRNNVMDWLERCFSGPEGGGVICIVDSVELAGTSRQVRKILESLRDPFFDAPGLLWVLCGTSAALEGALSSHILDGWLAPRRIHSVEEHFASELLRRRLEYFSRGGARPPVDEIGFEHIYAVVRSRLRTALRLCEDFASFLHRNPERRSSYHEWSKQLEIWLRQEAANSIDRPHDVPDKSWDLFDLMAKLGSDIRSSNPRVVNMEDAQQLQATAAPLLHKGLLVESELDDGGYMLSVTKAGWLVNYRRSDYSIPGSLGAV